MGHFRVLCNRVGFGRHIVERQYQISGRGKSGWERGKGRQKNTWPGEARFYEKQISCGKRINGKPTHSRTKGILIHVSVEKGQWGAEVDYRRVR